jgi:integrase
VDLKRCKIFINRSLTESKGGPLLERPKTKAAYRYIDLAPELIHELKVWKLQCPASPNQFVLCDALGRPMNRKSNNRQLRLAAERAEIKVLSMNNLRHSYASQHLIEGTSALEVSKLMGHSTPDVTLKVYSRWADREQSSSAVALAARILGAGAKKEETEATASE